MIPVFDFSYFPVLETERLRLRRMTHDDAQALIDLYGDPEVMRYLILDPPCDNIPAAIHMIDWMNGHFEQQNAMRWGITLKGQGDSVVGTCGFHFWSREHRRTDIGYDLQTAYWGGAISPRRRIHWCAGVSTISICIGFRLIAHRVTPAPNVCWKKSGLRWKVSGAKTHSSTGSLWT